MRHGAAKEVVGREDILPRAFKISLSRKPTLAQLPDLELLRLNARPAVAVPSVTQEELVAALSANLESDKDSPTLKVQSISVLLARIELLEKIRQMRHNKH